MCLICLIVIFVLLGREVTHLQDRQHFDAPVVGGIDLPEGS